jgi:hypothetical protein
MKSAEKSVRRRARRPRSFWGKALSMMSFRIHGAGKVSRVAMRMRPTPREILAAWGRHSPRNLRNGDRFTGSN